MNQPTIDLGVFQTLKESAGADFIGELIETYLTDAPQQIAKLRQVLAQRDAETFRRIAHSIKSSSANFGATRLVALALELEMAGKVGALDNLTDKIAQLELEYQVVAQELAKLAQA